MHNLPMCGIAKQPDHPLNQEALQLAQEASDHKAQAIQAALDKKEQETVGTLQKHHTEETHALQNECDNISKQLESTRNDLIEFNLAWQPTRQTRSMIST